jgi:hypothetical protein
MFFFHFSHAFAIYSQRYAILLSFSLPRHFSHFDFRFRRAFRMRDAGHLSPTLHLFSADAAFFRFAAISLLMPGFRRCVSSFAVSPFIALRHAFGFLSH